MSRNSVAYKGLFILLSASAVLVGTYALVLYGNPDGIRTQPFVTGKTNLPKLWYPMLWIHAASAGIAICIGWVQFVKRIRLRAVRIHRFIGSAYAILNVFGGLTGLYLAYYASGGWVACLGFAALSLSWLYTLAMGLHRILVKNDAVAHGRWMTYNFALTCAAISLRLYMGIGAALFGLIDPNDTFAVIAWICWIPNLLIAALLVRRGSWRSSTITKKARHRA